MYKVIVLGTNPASGLGGISYALHGYFEALLEAKISYIFIPTHDAASKHGRWKPWLLAIPKMLSYIMKEKRNGNSIIVYAHAGAGLSLFRKSFLLVLARPLGVRCLLQLHAPEVSQYIENVFGSLFFKTAICPAHELCVLTEWWKQRLNRFGKKINVIPNPMAKSLAMTARNSNIAPVYPKKRVNVLCLTRLVEGKGVDAVIRTMSLLPPQYNLIIAGGGTQEGELRKMAITLKVQDRINFVGWVSGCEKEKIFSDSHVFCLPSKLDSFGMVYVEAMAFGLPVVALEWEAIVDVVSSKETGLLVKDNNPKMLADAILNVMSNKHEYVVMSVNAKRWVIKQFGTQVVSKKLLSVMQDLV